MRQHPLCIVVLAGLVAPTTGAAATIDRFDVPPHLWTSSGGVEVEHREITAGDPLARPGQAAVEGVLSVLTPRHVRVSVSDRSCRGRHGSAQVTLLGAPGFDVRDAVADSLTYGGEAAEEPGRLRDTNRDGSTDLILSFPCRACRDDAVLEGRTTDGRPFSSDGVDAKVARPYAASSDWSASDGLRFWYHGRGAGGRVKVHLRDNRLPDPGPSRWRLAWNDEFSGRDPRGPDPDHWTPEIGDGTAQGIPGWGNNELEYYTDSPANAQTDGQGHLAISAHRADGSFNCYYGPCEYTSARLISRHKVEVGPGRIEARVHVPAGAGLWPAFWALGANIGDVGWPQSGEIDILEHVGRDPNRIFGTVHGPGYSGGGGITGIHDLGVPVADGYHVFAIEWQRDEIQWTVDGVPYHRVTRADLAGRPWVFDKPFFLILNLAVGGFLGGPVDPGLTFPRTMLIDYVRVYRATDTAERFTASFADDTAGWREVSLPWSAFTRSRQQPPGAPNDGLTLSEVWGYGFNFGELDGDAALVDDVRLIQPRAAVVTNANDAGPGSLRNAAAAVIDGGLVTFHPSLAGGVIPFSTGPLWISGKNLTIDASAAPGLALDGGGRDRLLIVDPGAGATVRGLTLRNGWAWDLAGGVLNNGSLTLDRCVLTGHIVGADVNDWWKGGGGIYTGGGSTLRLIDSTVSGNRTNLVDGGGIYAFQNSTVWIERSTVSGNVAGNVGGGLRMLGSGSIVNSTFSGNQATAWFGGALFHTDGVLSVLSSTITGNLSPDFANAAVFVGTFTPANATLNLANTIVGDNVGTGCFVAPFGAGVVTLASGGYNLFTDATCLPAATDRVEGGAGLEPLALVGGPTAAHVPGPASPAIDSADAATCPAQDQRGVSRPQGVGCDVGSVERVP